MGREDREEKNSKSKKVQQGRSSRHGSITKSGKVRSQTPKISPQQHTMKDSPKVSTRRKLARIDYRNKHPKSHFEHLY